MYLAVHVSCGVSERPAHALGTVESTVVRLLTCWSVIGQDSALIAVASTMGNSVVKDQAMLSRWGGEEFLVLVKIADPNTLTEVANKLLSAIRGISITNEQGTIHPTASIGAYYCDHPESVEGSVDKADLAMYHAKNGGRNRIEMFGDLKSEVGP